MGWGVFEAFHLVRGVSKHGLGRLGCATPVSRLMKGLFHEKMAIRSITYWGIYP